MNNKKSKNLFSIGYLNREFYARLQSLIFTQISMGLR